MMTRHILSIPIFKCASLEEVLKHFANKKNYDSHNDAKSEEKKNLTIKIKKEINISGIISLRREEGALWHQTMTLFIRATSPDE
jgi:hypothetical protein